MVRIRLGHSSSYAHKPLDSNFPSTLYLSRQLYDHNTDTIEDAFVYDGRYGLHALDNMDRLSINVLRRGDIVLVEFTYGRDLIADRWGTTFHWTRLALIRGGTTA